MSRIERLRQWYTEYEYPVTMFLVSRVGLFLLAYMSFLFLPMREGDGFWRGHPDNLFVDGWARWDSGWYASIAEKGYTNRRSEAKERDTGFFPLYPLVTRAVNTFVGDVYISGILVSNTAFFIALLLLYRLVKQKYDPGVAERTVALMVFNPFSFILSAMYSESLFLLAAVCMYTFSEREQWLPASLSAAAAGALRIPGLLVMVGLGLQYLEKIEFNWRRIRANILWLPLGFLGLGSFMLYLWLRFGQPLQFYISQQGAPGWRNSGRLDLIPVVFKDSLSPAGWATGNFPALYLIHLSAFLLALAVLFLTIRRQPLSYTAWGIAAVIASITRWTGMGRYLTVIFPIHIGVALLLSGKKFTWFLYLNIFLLSLFTIMFTHWHYVS